MYIFKIKDKSERTIYLHNKDWKHITHDHPNITNIEEIISTLIAPTKITQSENDKNVKWYYKLNKNKKKYFMVSVKYLNGKGFIITAFYTTNIK